MIYYHCGVIDVTPPMTEDIVKKAEKIFYAECRGEVYVTPGAVEFSDYEDGSSFEDGLREFVDLLSQNGYKADGLVRYYGDDNGGYDITANIIQDISLKEIYIMEADDSELLEELRKRGYSFVVKEPPKAVVQVSGGVVQAVYATTKDLSVQVLDEDNGLSEVEENLLDEVNNANTGWKEVF